jgi:hypothetical protein
MPCQSSQRTCHMLLWKPGTYRPLIVARLNWLQYEVGRGEAE